MSDSNRFLVILYISYPCGILQGLAGLYLLVTELILAGRPFSRDAMLMLLLAFSSAGSGAIWFVALQTRLRTLRAKKAKQD